MKKILLLLFIWVILLTVVNKLSLKFLADFASYELPKNQEIVFRSWITPWLNYDGRNYLEIANRGYVPVRTNNTDLRVYFPLYPLLIRILSFNLRFNPVLVGLGISFLSFLGSLFVFNKLLLHDKFSKEKRNKALLLLLLFPTSFYFIAYYTEGLFLLLILLTFYFLNKTNFKVASIFAALTTATRLSGLAILPVLLWEAIQYYKKTKKFPFSIIIAPLGFVLFGIYIHVTTGNALAIILRHKDWDKPFGVFGMWYALKNGLTKIIYGSGGLTYNPLNYSVEVLELMFALFLLLIIFKSYKKIRFSYWLYLLFSSLIIFFSGVLSGIPRYMMVIFPVYIYLTNAIPKKYFYIVCFCFAVLFVYLSALFLRGYWVA